MCHDAQAVVNEDTTADALMLQKENARLRKELEMFRQLQQVGPIAQCSCNFLARNPRHAKFGCSPMKVRGANHALFWLCHCPAVLIALLAEVAASVEMLLPGHTFLPNGMMLSRQAGL